jgi:hypothetical protein
LLRGLVSVNFQVMQWARADPFEDAYFFPDAFAKTRHSANQGDCAVTDVYVTQESVQVPIGGIVDNGWSVVCFVFEEFRADQLEGLDGRVHSG